MSRLINSLDYLNARNYSISTAPLVMGLRRSGDQDGLSMVVCLSSIIIDGRVCD